MRLGSLFSGIAGLDLGLCRALDAAPVWFCDAEPHCREVLEARHPGVPLYPDVAALDPAQLPPVDVLAGGFPCQNISLAGNGEGLAGEKSGLWFEMARIIDGLSPTWIVIENVGALLKRGLNRVLADLHRAGYAAEWETLEAVAVGAYHIRPRVFVVAYPDAPAAPVVFHDRGEFVRDAFKRNRGGVLYEREPLVASGVGKAWHAGRGVFARPLPTPSAAEYGSSQNGVNSTRPSAGTPSLSTMARHGLFPTPTADDGRGSRRATARTPSWTSNPGTTLTDAVQPELEGAYPAVGGRLWATPRASDWRSGQVFGRNARPLCEQVARAATPVKKAERPQLSPRWVSWLMGFPLDWLEDDLEDDLEDESEGAA